MGIRILLVAVMLASSISAAQDCDFKNSVHEAEKSLGMADIMVGAKYIEKRNDEFGFTAIAKKSNPFKFGEFKGLSQSNVYIVNDCVVVWALVMKVDNDGETVASAKAFFRKDGSLQSICAGGAETEMFTILPFNGEIEPNTGCTCFDGKNKRTLYSKVYGCMEPNEYVMAKKEAMESISVIH